MRFVKRKKPSHDIFNKIYVEEMLDAYERLVKRLSSSRIYFDIIPKQYQRGFCDIPFGTAFSETSGETFSRIFGSAFNDKVNPCHDVHFDRKKYKLHPAFETMYHYDLAEPLAKESYEQKRWDKETRTIVSGMLKALKSHKINSANEENTETTVLLNDIRLYQGTLEYLHVLYTVNKYKILSENASSDARAIFRERNLAAKNRYIDMLEDTLRWRKMKQQEKFSVFLKHYYSQLEKLDKLNDEAQCLEKEVQWYMHDKNGSKEVKALTGFKALYQMQEWISRRAFWAYETKGIKKMVIQQIPLYIEEKRIQALILNMKQLCNNLKIFIDKSEKFSWYLKTAVQEQLDYLLDAEIEECLEIVSDFNHSTEFKLRQIGYSMELMDINLLSLALDGQRINEKNIQKQNHKIDQLEMKIISHLIDTTTMKDVKNKECDKANSTCHNNVMENTNSNTRVTLCTPTEKSKDSKNTKKSTIIHVDEEKKIIELNKISAEYAKSIQLCKKHRDLEAQMEKLLRIQNTWLKKHKLNEEDILKYEKALDNIISNLHVNKYMESAEFTAERVVRMEKAANQIIFLSNHLKMELLYLDTNLNKIACQMKPSESKYSESRANSIETCDTCKLCRSNIIDCTKYITYMLYEENLNRFYILTTAMDQLSFLLHMMRTSIFRDGMSRRNQWSIKKMKKKIVKIRNRLRQILGLKIVINDEYINIFGSANSYNGIFMDQSNNKDILKD